MVTKKGQWPVGAEFSCGSCYRRYTISDRRLKENPPREPGVLVFACPHCKHVNTHRRNLGARTR